jgi:hypothetical protein
MLRAYRATPSQSRCPIHLDRPIPASPSNPPPHAPPSRGEALRPRDFSPRLRDAKSIVSSCRLALATWGGHPAGRVAASCREGLSLSCQSRRVERRAAASEAMRTAHPSVLAPGSALGSHLCVALSSAQAALGCSRRSGIRQPRAAVAGLVGDASGPLPACDRARRRSPSPAR